MQRTRKASVLMFMLLTSLKLAASTRPSDETSIPRFKPRDPAARALIAVLGDNEATETTDYVVPYGILAEAGVADVLALSTEPGPIQMKPALRFTVHATIHEFDARHPGGADYVIVPNIYEGAGKPHVLAWVRSQARLGATIVGICDGVPVLANAGLLNGKRATGHWRSIDALEKRHPSTHWLRNRRYVADGNVITTSGVSASIPISVALIEAIGGRAKAKEVAARIGVKDWSPIHDSSQFRLGWKLVTALTNKAMWWRHERFGIEAREGVDEIALALMADAYSRTRRSWVFSVAKTDAPIRTHRGLTLLPDRIASDGQPLQMLTLHDGAAAEALERGLDAIEERYGKRTAALVAVQIEYPFGH